METYRIDLYEYFGLKRGENAYGYLNVYTHYDTIEGGFKKIRPAMIVIAGGGYMYMSDREKEPIALTYLAEGYNVFTLDYSVGSVCSLKYPTQLIEGCMAVAYVRENAEKLLVNPDQIAAVGFSAGGHLCGTLATLTGERAVKDALKEKAALCKPNAVVLSYPVITSGEKAHRGSFNVICGDDKELLAKTSLENKVTADSVPAFIWATANDGAVPSENSLMLAMAYKKAGVPFELHIFDKGPHGLALCSKETSLPSYEGLENEHVRHWIKLSVEWLKNLGFEMEIVLR